MTSFIDLPPSVLVHVVLRLPDPASLAASCRATAALLRREDILLAWAAAWDVHASDKGAERFVRHPAYALLQWRRLRSMKTLQLAALLLRYKQPPDQAAASMQSAASWQRAGQAVTALLNALPHADDLLLGYAAQAGQLQLVEDLIDAGAADSTRSHRWPGAQSGTMTSALVLALLAAAAGGHVDVMNRLLAVFDALDPHSAAAEAAGGADALELHMLEAAAVSEAAGPGPAHAVWQLMQLFDRKAVAEVVQERQLLTRALQEGRADPTLITMLANTGGVPAAPDPHDFLDIAHAALYGKHRNAHALALLLGRHAAHAAASATVLHGTSIAQYATPDNLEQLRAAVRLVPCPHWTYLIDYGQLAHNLLVGTWDNTAALQAVWDAPLTQPQRTQLAFGLVKALASAAGVFVAELAVTWVLDNALPILSLATWQDLKGAGGFDVWESLIMAAEAMLRGGFASAAQVVLALPPVAALLAQLREDNWHRLNLASATQSGRLWAAVWRLSAGEVRALLEGGPDGPDPGLLCMPMGLFQRLSGDHGAVAEVAQVLAGALASDDEFMMRPVHLCGVKLDRLRALAAGSDRFFRLFVGPQAHVVVGQSAIGVGMLDEAMWLVCHPGQAGTYFSDVLLGNGHSSLDLTPSRHVRLLTALLQRLADHSAVASAAANAVGSNCSAHEEGASGGGAANSIPAGARHMAPEALVRMVSVGNPDLLCAVLTCIHAWA